MSKICIQHLYPAFVLNIYIEYSCRTFVSSILKRTFICSPLLRMLTGHHLLTEHRMKLSHRSTLWKPIFKSVQSSIFQRASHEIVVMSAQFPPEPLKRIAEEVAALLRQRKETVSVAETAAGGLISAALLSTPGASAFYKGGVTVRTCA